MKVEEAIELMDSLLGLSAPGSMHTLEGVLNKHQREALKKVVALARLAEEARIGIKKYCEEPGHQYELICDVLEKLEAENCGS